jgi:hypothetical protein
MRVSLARLDKDAVFAEGHELDDDHAAAVPVKMIGKMLTREQAAALLDKMERQRRQSTYAR